MILMNQLLDLKVSSRKDAFNLLNLAEKKLGTINIERINKYVKKIVELDGVPKNEHDYTVYYAEALSYEINHEELTKDIEDPILSAIDIKNNQQEYIRLNQITGLKPESIQK